MTFSLQTAIVQLFMIGAVLLILGYVFRSAKARSRRRGGRRE